MLGLKLSRLVAAVGLAIAGTAAAQQAPAPAMPDPILAAGDLRTHQDLSGAWH
jgi:hypothetical protein